MDFSKIKKLRKYNRKDALKSLLSLTTSESEYYMVGNRKFASLPNYKKIDNFIATHNLTDKYTAQDLYRWHKIITSSCDKGKIDFLNEHNFKMDDTFTIPEFFEYAKQYWGGEIIELVEEKMNEMKNNEEKDKKE